MKSLFLGVAVAIGLAIAPAPTRANTLIGDVISGSYDYPCVGGVDPGRSYFFNPFVVTGPAAQTTLFVGNPKP